MANMYLSSVSYTHGERRLISDLGEKGCDDPKLIHAVVHSRLSTGATEGFRELLPEFMYFAVLPYFGAETAGAEMQAARA